MKNGIMDSDILPDDKRQKIEGSTLMELFLSLDDARIMDDIFEEGLNFPKMHVYTDNEDLGGPAVMICLERVPASGSDDGILNKENLVKYLEAGLNDEWTRSEIKEMKIQELLALMKSLSEEQILKMVKDAFNSDPHYSEHFLAL